jgi:hypothetical protein
MFENGGGIGWEISSKIINKKASRQDNKFIS